MECSQHKVMINVGGDGYPTYQNLIIIHCMLISKYYMCTINMNNYYVTINVKKI